jgi:hypothetical protein
MFSFLNRRRGVHRSRGLVRGGILGSLLLSAAPFLYRRFTKKRDSGRYGLREAYSGGSEWTPEQERLA